MSWVNVPPAEWPIRIGGRSSPRITSVRWSMTAGHGQVLDRGRVGVQGLDLDLETRVGRGEHAVALLLVVGLPVLPTAWGHPEAMDQDDGVGVHRLPPCSPE